MSATQSEQAQKTVVLTDVAAQKVRGLLDQEGRDDLRLRVAVQPGGCSGLRYQLFFDERSLDGDVVSEFPTDTPKWAKLRTHVVHPSARGALPYA